MKRVILSAGFLVTGALFANQGVDKAGTKTFEGTGFYYDHAGDKGIYNVDLTITKTEADFTLENSYEWDGGSENFAWTGVKNADGSFSMAVDGEVIGLGKCFKKGSHAEAPSEGEGEAPAEGEVPEPTEDEAPDLDLEEFAQVPGAKNILGKVLEKTCVYRMKIGEAFISETAYKFAGGILVRKGTKLAGNDAGAGFYGWKEILWLTGTSSDTTPNPEPIDPIEPIEEPEVELPEIEEPELP